MVNPEAIEQYRNDIYDLVKQVSYPNRIIVDKDYSPLKYVRINGNPKSKTWTENNEDCRKLRVLYCALGNEYDVWYRYKEGHYVPDYFIKLELTRENVYKLMNECKKTENTKNIIKCNFYAKNVDKKTPVLEFDSNKIDEYENTIKYMLGQLHAIHAHKETLSPAYGLMNYKGQNWTNDNTALFSLYYLGVASIVLPPFEKATSGGVASPIGEYKSLKPTFWPPIEE